MAFVTRDRVKELSTSLGTGAVTLNGPVNTFFPFYTQMSVGDTFYYSIVHRTQNEFEIGLGTLILNGAVYQIGRTTVIKSSNSNNLVDFTTGTKEVSLIYTATQFDAITSINSALTSVAVVIDSQATQVATNTSLAQVAATSAVAAAEVATSVEQVVTSLATFVTAAASIADVITSLAAVVSSNTVLSSEYLVSAQTAAVSANAAATSANAAYTAILSVQDVVTSVEGVVTSLRNAVAADTSTTFVYKTSAEAAYLGAVSVYDGAVSVYGAVTSVAAAVSVQASAVATNTSLAQQAAVSASVAAASVGAASYFVVSATSDLPNERVLTFNTTFFDYADPGAGGTYSVSIKPIYALLSGTNVFTATATFNTTISTDHLKAAGSGGLTLYNSAGTQYMVGGAGPSTGTTWAGQANFQAGVHVSAEASATRINTVSLVAGTAAVSGSFVVSGASTFASVTNFTKAARGAVVTLTDATSIASDMALGNNFVVTLAGNRTLDIPTNVVLGQSGTYTFIQDGTGGRTLAYTSVFDFPGGTAPTLTTTSAAVDVLAYYVYSSTAILARMTNDLK